MDEPLAIEGLSVVYGTRKAVDRLSIAVRPGEIYGLLGSNGAGKTSTIKSVVGLVRPSEGRVRVFGADVATDALTTKARVGYVPETSLLYEALTPREFLEFVAGVRRLPSEVVADRAARFVAAFRLEPEFDEPILTLSNGTRQKVLLIAALLHRPSLLVLDEPLNGLDPRSVRIVKELLERYVADGRRGILFSTHTMEVAEQLCHRVGILDGGRLRGEGTIAALRGQVQDGDATLEELFLRLTDASDGIRSAVDRLEGPG